MARKVKVLREFVMKSQINQIFSGVFFRDQEKRRADEHRPEERLCRRAIAADAAVHADDFSGAKIMLGMKKFFHGATALAMAGLFALGFSQALHAQAVDFEPGENSNWNCDTLYGGTDTGYQSVYRFLDPAVNSDRQRVFQEGSGVLEFYQDTLALGPWPGDDANKGKLVMYMWRFDGSNRKVFGLFEGESVPQEIMTTPFTGGYPQAAGGEVNQLTGEIYFTGIEGARVANVEGTLMKNFQLRLCNPVTGTCRSSSEVRPVAGTLSDDVYTDAQRFVSSDMAIDAEGNAYLLIGNALDNKKLIRVVPGADGAVWYYNIVKTFPTFGTTAAGNMWGMGFLNGSLLLLGSGGASLKQVNPLSGAVTDRGSISPILLDLTTCQVAPVLRGKIYNDANGDGVISSAEEAANGVPNVLVEIWEDNGSGNVVWQGEQRTSPLGEYSFIVGSTSATYYVKLKQPKIGGVNGVNAYQTWASANAGDANVQNKVTAYCTNGTTSAGSANDSAVTASAQCKGGAHFRGSDAGTLDPSGTTSLSDFMARSNFFSKVVMSTDKEVAIADFALTGRANHNDAPQTYGDALHVTPAPANYWLGDTVTTQDGAEYPNDDSAAAIVSHDGIEVNIPEGSSRWVPLQGASLTSGVTYGLRAKAYQPSGEPGYFSAWVNTGTSSSFTSTGAVQVSTDQQLLDGTTSGEIESGYIGFNYTPTGISGAPVWTFARARFSSTDGVPATGGQVVETTNSVKPWALEGEVEDYRFYAVKGQLILATESSEPATFTYAMSNIANTAPSFAEDSLTTTAANTVVYQNSSMLHAFDTLGTDIEIYQTPPNSDWGAPSGISCTDNTGAGVMVSENVAKTEIPKLVAAGCKVVAQGDAPGADISLYTDAADYSAEAARAMGEELIARNLRGGVLVMAQAADQAAEAFADSFSERYPQYSVHVQAVPLSEAERAEMIPELAGVYCMIPDAASTWVTTKDAVAKELTPSPTPRTSTPRPSPTPEGAEPTPVPTLAPHVAAGNIVIIATDYTAQNLELLADDDIFAIAARPYFDAAAQGMLLLDRLLRGVQAAEKLRLNVPIIKKANIAKYQSIVDEALAWMGGE